MCSSIWRARLAGRNPFLNRQKLYLRQTLTTARVGRNMARRKSPASTKTNSTRVERVNKYFTNCCNERTARVSYLYNQKGSVKIQPTWFLISSQTIVIPLRCYDTAEQAAAVIQDFTRQGRLPVATIPPLQKPIDESKPAA